MLEVTGRRPSGGVALEQVRGGIEEFLRMRTIESELRALESQAQVIYFQPEEEEDVSSPAREAGSEDAEESAEPAPRPAPRGSGDETFR